MPRASPIILSSNAGELSPTLDGRIDLAKYSSGCKRLEGFIPTVQGPAVRRGGTRFVAETKDSAARSWLVKFEFSATQAFILEFGDEYVRFYTDHGVLESSPGTPYEIVSPYALADLTTPEGTCALSVVQSGDVLYIANAYRTYEPRTLTRVANTNWVFAVFAPNQGPFLETNSTSTDIQVSATSGSVTLTASAAVFAATDVGRLIRIEVETFTTRPWETAKAYTLGTFVRSDGKTYAALNNATSGTSAPAHEGGTAYDGTTGVQWVYVNAGYGIARITAVTDSTHATATVIGDTLNGLFSMPVELVSAGSTRWALGAWSATTEYPASVTFFRNRLFWAGKLRLWGSVPDDFANMSEDFFGEVRADNAIKRIVATRDVNSVLWLFGADKLVIGTGGGDLVGGEVTNSEPLSPSNFSIVPQSRKRANGVQPVGVGTSVCYVQRAGRKLLSLDFSIDVDRYKSTDLAVLADRVTRTGIIATAYQGEPYSIVWCVRGDGKLVGFTYEQDQDVRGWHRHPIGGSGIVESVAVIPTPDGAREELWLIVRRTIDGEAKRYVEFMERPWEGADEDGTPGDDQEDAFYVDSGLTYDGAATDTITGLDHLEGATVQVLADGARQNDKVVSGGAIELDHAASVVQAGLQAVSRYVPMRIEAGAADGTAQGRIKRVSELTLRLFETLGGKCGRYGQELDSISLRESSTPQGEANAIASGDARIDFEGDYETDGLVEIVQDEPFPMTIVAVMPTVRTA